MKEVTDRAFVRLGPGYGGSTCGQHARWHKNERPRTSSSDAEDAAHLTDGGRAAPALESTHSRISSMQLFNCQPNPPHPWSHS
jgi:hypothetical protein